MNQTHELSTPPSLSPKTPSSIQGMFSAISRKYDLANSILSFGIHHQWKKKLVREAQVRPKQKILDCATGTGDLAFLFEKALNKTGSVTGSDFCKPMLEVARKKASLRKSSVQLDWADVTQLHYPDHEFDLASISFGIRNVHDPRKALSELARVVKPGGKVLVLEFGQPHSKIIHHLFNFYSNQVLPTLGGWISGQPQAYRYLQTSSASFPCGPEFLEIAKSVKGYANLSYQSIQFGIAYLYILETHPNPL